MIGTIPSWQQTSPTDLANSFAQGGQWGQREGAQLADEAHSNQSHELEQERQMQQEHAQAVADELNKQRMSLMTTAAANAYAAQQDYQNAIKGGMDPARAAMIYGPAMSGGKMTGYSPIFHDYATAHTPAIAPKPVTDTSGKIIGYSDSKGAVRFIPIPKPPPVNYETVTTITPGTKGTPGLPPRAAIPSDSEWYNPTTWGDKEIPAQPGVAAIPGTPETRTTRKVPISATQETNSIDYLPPPDFRNAPAAPQGAPAIPAPTVPKVVAPPTISAPTAALPPSGKTASGNSFKILDGSGAGGGWQPKTTAPASEPAEPTGPEIQKKVEAEDRELRKTADYVEDLRRKIAESSKYQPMVAADLKSKLPAAEARLNWLETPPPSRKGKEPPAVVTSWF